MFETCTVAICGAGAESSPVIWREQTARYRRALGSAGQSVEMSGVVQVHLLRLPYRV